MSLDFLGLYWSIEVHITLVSEVPFSFPIQITRIKNDTDWQILVHVWIHVFLPRLQYYSYCTIIFIFI